MITDLTIELTGGLLTLLTLRSYWCVLNTAFVTATGSNFHRLFVGVTAIYSFFRLYDDVRTDLAFNLAHLRTFWKFYHYQGTKEYTGNENYCDLLYALRNFDNFGSFRLLLGLDSALHYHYGYFFRTVAKSFRVQRRLLFDNGRVLGTHSFFDGFIGRQQVGILTWHFRHANFRANFTLAWVFRLVIAWFRPHRRVGTEFSNFVRFDFDIAGVLFRRTRTLNFFGKFFHLKSGQFPRHGWAFWGSRGCPSLWLI